MNPVWLQVLIFFCELIVTLVANYVLISWRLQQLEKNSADTTRELINLRLKVAAFTGKSNGGYDYE